MEQITFILTFILKSFIHVWPYLLVTIPLAVWVKLSDFSKHFQSIMTRSPWLSILLATAVGAISPFCSCGVIPVISSLLIGGVPLAPVFAFWVASPSMDPEIFFLSVSILGWKLAIWRLASTFGLSLMAGIITHFLVKSGYITSYLKEKKEKASAFSLRRMLLVDSKLQVLNVSRTLPHLQFSGMAVSCCPERYEEEAVPKACGCDSTVESAVEVPLWKRIRSESGKSVWMISKFMGLAFLLNALLTLYVP